MFAFAVLARRLFCCAKTANQSGGRLDCRCTTIGYDPDDELDELETEQEQLEYDEWYERYVEGREQTAIAEHQTAPALLGENQPTVPINPLTNAGDGGTISNRDSEFYERLRNGLVNTTIDGNAQKNHILSKAWTNQVCK